MDSSNTNGEDKPEPEPEPEGRLVRIRRRFTEWRIHQHVARGMAYGVGSSAVSVLVFWVQTRY
ncbi:hypothetical protein PV332_14390 [Streptomyces scabiei]|uniref:hypothetical protein n=1 Tax=Streptomyces scabiei TaxID=1930 RepID=UPI0029BCA80A|nr:hypothetical protein [Streptomyces scabiei]MDX2576658.1 hypothetical protein [Streptomyces scabiei]MDX3027660.1 hypothetical protein [Streptomyces scabiei]MDX3206327.1 hypothetical protein [Streptomyces scabiei]